MSRIARHSAQLDLIVCPISGLEKKLDYLKECNVNYLHLMPFLATPKGKSDGGYAVAGCAIIGAVLTMF